MRQMARRSGVTSPSHEAESTLNQRPSRGMGQSFPREQKPVHMDRERVAKTASDKELWELGVWFAATTTTTTEHY